MLYIIFIMMRLRKLKENGDKMENIMREIENTLFELQDKKYRDFQSKLIPNIDKNSVIGVRTQKLRDYAKKLAKHDGLNLFMSNLPHRYFEENQLHAFIISEIKTFEECMSEVCRFLPYVDNWATCDQMSPKVFKKHREELINYIEEWILSKDAYTVRFGIKTLMNHFLDEDFDFKYPEMVASIRSDEYYVNMMIAWYFATALAKQYDAVLPFIKNRSLDKWTHNKAIQKAVESRQIEDAKKAELKQMKR